MIISENRVTCWTKKIRNQWYRDTGQSNRNN